MVDWALADILKDTLAVYPRQCKASVSEKLSQVAGGCEPLRAGGTEVGLAHRIGTQLFLQCFGQGGGSTPVR